MYTTMYMQVYIYIYIYIYAHVDLSSEMCTHVYLSSEVYV